MGCRTSRWDTQSAEDRNSSKARDVLLSPATRPCSLLRSVWVTVFESAQSRELFTPRSTSPARPTDLRLNPDPDAPGATRPVPPPIARSAKERPVRRPRPRHPHSLAGDSRVPMPWAHGFLIRCGPAMPARSEAAYRLESDRGRPNDGSTLLSKRVKARTRSPVRVSTRTPVPWRMPPVGARR